MLWNNRLVQGDTPQLDDDPREGEAQPSTPAGPSSASEPDDDGTQQESRERDESAPGASSNVKGASGQDEAKSKDGEKSKDPGQRRLVRRGQIPGPSPSTRFRTRDAQDNLDTRPPADEAVSFKSVSIAEVFVGQEIDSLTKALAAIDWIDSDQPITEQINEARKGASYLKGNFYMTSGSAEARRFRYPYISSGSSAARGFRVHGCTSIPVGIDRIYGKYYVLGPSIVAVVLTFALADGEDKKLDGAIRDDAESMLNLGKFSIKTVEIVKRERVRTIRDDFTQRCLDWLKDKMPGSLSGKAEGPRSPTYVLVTLAEGKPFETHDPYMYLLDLEPSALTIFKTTSKFVNYDFLFLTHRIGMHENQMIGAFNEAEALSSGWLRDLGAAPEAFHEAVSSLMIADAMYAVLVSFEPRLQDVRAELGKLDLDRAAGSQVAELRNRLLGISRDVSIVCSDVSVLLTQAITFWSGLLPLTLARPTGATTAPAAGTTVSADATAEAKKRQLRATMDNLQAQEVGLRDLILVTSQSMSETRNLDLQTKVLDLTNRLRSLTGWLIALTVILVVLGVAALWVQVANTPTVNVKVIQTSHPGSPTFNPTPRPSPTSKS